MQTRRPQDIFIVPARSPLLFSLRTEEGKDGLNRLADFKFRSVRNGFGKHDSPSYPHVVRSGSFSARTAGVDRAGRFNKHDVAFFVRKRFVLQSPGDNEQFSIA